MFWPKLNKNYHQLIWQTDIWKINKDSFFITLDLALSNIKTTEIVLEQRRFKNEMFKLTSQKMREQNMQDTPILTAMQANFSCISLVNHVCLFKVAMLMKHAF